MKKILLAAAFALLPALSLSANALATENYGSIGGGNIVTSKNVTANGTFADVTNATCGDTVKIRAYVHNPGPNSLTGVRAQAVLPTGQATSFSVKMTISASNANPKSESDTTSIMSDKAATLSYVAGTAEYFDAKGARLGSLDDSIVTSGADVPGNVDVSTLNARYVQLQAKLACSEAPKYIKVCELASKNIITIDEKAYDAAKHSKNLADCAAKPPVPGEIVVCETATKNVVTIKENEFDSSKHSKDLSKCAEAPVVVTELPQTGATGVIAVVASLVAAAAGYVVTARKNLLG
jgi:uncharacterized repeat protein (TIGR01451 family)